MQKHDPFQNRPLSRETLERPAKRQGGKSRSPDAPRSNPLEGPDIQAQLAPIGALWQSCAHD